MTALELFAIIILAGAILVLLYYYLQDIGFSFNNFRTSENRTRTIGVTENTSEQREKNIGRKAGTNKTGEGGTMAGMSEKMAGMSERIKGKVKEVPISTDILSNRIESFLNEQSDQLIKNWDLATKQDLSGLEKRFNKVSRNVDELERRFNEYRGYTNKKLERIEKRLTTLENPEEDDSKN